MITTVTVVNRRVLSRHTYAFCFDLVFNRRRTAKRRSDSLQCRMLLKLAQSTWSDVKLHEGHVRAHNLKM